MHGPVKTRPDRFSTVQLRRTASLIPVHNWRSHQTFSS